MADINDLNAKETLEGFLDRIKKASSFGIDEFASQFERITTLGLQINNTFLQTKERIGEIKRSIADATPAITRLGGDIQSTVETIEGVSRATSRNVLVTSETAAKLYATATLLDTSTESLVNNFADIGIESANIGKNIEDSIDYVRGIGLNAGQIMEKVLDNTEQLNRYQFEGGVKGLTKMAAQAAMLRVDMSQTFQLAEKVLDPESAVEVASAFQRLGVAAGNLVDPFQLMNLSINDPSGLQDSLANVAKQFTYFDEKTKSFKINPQGVLTLRQMESEAGLASGTLSKMGLAAAELDERLSQISPSIKFENEEDKLYLANIGRMGEGGRYEVLVTDKEGKEEYKALSELTQTEFDKLIQEQKTAPKTAEEIQRSQLKNSDKLVADVAAIRNAIVGGVVTSKVVTKPQEEMEKIYEVIMGTATKTKAADASAYRDIFTTTMKPLTDVVSDIVEGKTAGETLSNFSDNLASTVGEVKKQFISIGEDLGINVEEAWNNYIKSQSNFFGTKSKPEETSNEIKRGVVPEKKEESKTIPIVVPPTPTPINQGLGYTPSPTPTPFNNVIPLNNASNTNEIKLSDTSISSIADVFSSNQKTTYTELSQESNDLLKQNIDSSVNKREKISEVPPLPTIKPVIDIKPSITAQPNLKTSTIDNEVKETKLSDVNAISNMTDKILSNITNSNQSLIEKLSKEKIDASKLVNKEEYDKLNKIKSDIINANKLQNITEPKSTENKLFNSKISEFIDGFKSNLEDLKKQSFTDKKPLGEMLVKGKERYIEDLSKTVGDIKTKNSKIDISGLVTVDVKLPPEFNQLDKSQMKQMFTATFNHPNFKQFVYKIASYEDEGKSPAQIDYTPQ